MRIEIGAQSLRKSCPMMTASVPYLCRPNEIFSQCHYHDVHSTAYPFARAHQQSALNALMLAQRRGRDILFTTSDRFESRRFGRFNKARDDYRLRDQSSVFVESPPPLKRQAVGSSSSLEEEAALETSTAAALAPKIATHKLPVPTTTVSGQNLIELDTIYEPYLVHIAEFERRDITGQRNRYDQFLQCIEKGANDAESYHFINEHAKTMSCFLFPMPPGRVFKVREITLPFVDDDDTGLLTMRRYLSMPEIRGVSLRRNLMRTFDVVGGIVDAKTRRDHYASSSVQTLGFGMASRAMKCAKRFAFATQGWDEEVFRSATKFAEVLEAEISSELDCGDEYGGRRK